MAVPLTLSSVPAQTPYVQYVSGSSQTVFPYPFEITQDSDLVCLVNGVQQATDSGYTLSGQGTTVGGNLTFTVGQTAGTIITLYRNISIARITQLSQNGTFFSGNFNNEFNRIYLIMQQLQNSLLPGGNQAYALMIPNSNNPAPTTLLTPAAYKNTYLSFDSNGNPQPAVLTSSGSLTNAIITALTNVQTAAELAAGVTPNTLYPVGSLRRYGADPTGVSSSSPALAAAQSCCSYVWDDFPGGGKYLFNTQVTLTNYPLTIAGQGKNNGDTNVNSGTLFTLKSGITSLFLGAYLDGVNIRDIGFKFAAGSAGQYIIEGTTVSSVPAQFRGWCIERCAFIGTGAGDTNIAIYINTGTGGSQYSAFNTIRDCYFGGGLSGAIKLAGDTTPNFITNNTFLGYSGAGSTAAGSGIEIDIHGSEVKIVGNYFEGWTQGVYSNGSTGAIQQIGNDYESCTYGYNWVAPASGIINNQSVGETGVAGTYSGTSSLDGSAMQLFGGLGFLATGGAVQSTRGFQEGTGSGSNLRTALLGYGTTAAVVMGANGGGSISAQSTTTWSYSQVGGTLFLTFQISATLTGASTTALTVPLPASLTSIVATQVPISILNNATASNNGIAYINASGGTLNFAMSATGSGDWTAGSVAVQGQIAIRIIS